MTYQGAEAAEERVPEVAEREGKVLVEEVAQELAHAVVRPAEYQHISSFGIEKGNLILCGHPVLTSGRGRAVVARGSGTARRCSPRPAPPACPPARRSPRRCGRLRGGYSKVV